MADRDQFLQALQALYGFDSARQSQANKWLNEFSKQPAAWQIGLDMLHPSSPTEPLFFCANMLLNKVRGEWGKLSSEQRSHLNTTLLQKLNELSADPRVAAMVVQRVCLIVACIAAMTGGDAAQHFLNQAFDLASTAAAAGMERLGTALIILTSVAEEASDLDRARSAALMPVLAGTMPRLLGLMTSIMDTYSAEADKQQQQQQQQAGGASGSAAAAVAGGAGSGATSGSSSSSSGRGMPYESAIKCLHTWLRIDPEGSGCCCMSPGELAAAAEPLLHKLLTALSSHDEGVCTAASELLSSVLGPGKVGPNPGADGAVLRTALSALLQQQAVVREPPERGPAALALANVALALSERDTELVTSNTDEAISLAGVMLVALQRSDHACIDPALNYFIVLNTVPVGSRHPQLQRAVYQQLLPTALHLASFPPGFVSWEEEVDMDEEGFGRFREQLLGDALDTTYAMLQDEYLKVVQHVVHSASSWQQYEAAVFALQVVAQSVKARLHGKAAASEAAAQATSDLLLAIFNHLCSPASQAQLVASPWAVATVAAAVGEYALWFGKAAGAAPLENALRLLLEALRHQPAWKRAAAAFRNICVRCAGQLSSAAVLFGLMDVAMSTVAPLPGTLSTAATAGSPAPPQGAAAGSPQPASQHLAAICPLDYEDRAAVVEGLARIVSGLLTSDAGQAGLRLMAPFLARAQSLVAAAGTGVLTQQQLKSLAAELRLISCAIRFMEFPQQAAGLLLPGGAAAAAAAGSPGGSGSSPAGAHPALQLLESCWPVLMRIGEAPGLMRDAEVVEALCEVLQRALLAAKLAARPLLSHLISTLLSVFTTSRNAAALYTFGTIMELFGQLKGPAAGGAAGGGDGGSSGDSASSLQLSALDRVCGSCAALLEPSASPAALAADGEVLSGLLGLADRYLIFARDLLVSSPRLASLIDLAVRSTGLREKDPVSSALALLAHLLAALDKTTATAQAEGDAEAAAHARALEAAVAACGPRLMHTLVWAAVDTCPRQLLRPLAGCFWALLTSPLVGPTARGWLATELCRPELHDGHGQLTQAECAKFGALASRQPPLQRARFDALLSDFAGIARGEATPDALLGYEM